MTAFHIAAAVGGILLVIYLVVALIYPERF